jgi:hypothetical protein
VEGPAPFHPFTGAAARIGRHRTSGELRGPRRALKVEPAELLK